MSHPFVYLNHGALDPDSFDKAESVWIAFQAPVPEAERVAVMKSCPASFAGFFRWDDVLFYSESIGDMYNAIVAASYGGDQADDVSAEAALAFSKAVEAWILDIHARAPVAFFIGPSRSLDDDGWNAWSYERVGSVIIPWLEHYLDTHPDLPDEVEDMDVEDEVTSVGEVDGEDMGDAGPQATPMDRATLAYIAQHLDAGELTASEKKRARALSVRVGWTNEGEEIGGADEDDDA